MRKAKFKGNRVSLTIWALGKERGFMENRNSPLKSTLEACVRSLNLRVTQPHSEALAGWYIPDTFTARQMIWPGLKVYRVLTWGNRLYQLLWEDTMHVSLTSPRIPDRVISFLKCCSKCSLLKQFNNYRHTSLSYFIFPHTWKIRV